MNLAALQGLLRSLAVACDAVRGRPVRRLSRDRLLLEQHILPRYSVRPDVRRVLFVGCARYTRHYARLFEHAEYWTLDPSARRQRWGARRHIRDRLERLDRHVSPGHFDLIVCNGVLGWGLNRHDDAEAAFSVCHRALRAGGELVLGWNDVHPRNAMRPESLRSLRAFERTGIDGLAGPVLRVDVPHRHVVEFYRKPGSVQAVSVVGASGNEVQSAMERHRPSMHSS